ncbi:MAG: AAA family ATPase [Nitrospirae bacterium]|nr:AAA family ATPase [Nitrospirota bacterium]
MNEKFEPELRSKINPQEYYGQRVEGYKAKPDGGGSFLCSFHEEKTASASHTADGRWHCFGSAACGGGDLFDFHMKLYSLDRKAAVADLERLYGGTPASPAQPQTQAAKSIKWASKDDVDMAHNALIGTAKLQEFQSRYGLNTETVRRYRLGLLAGKFTIPISMGDGRFNLKQHKGVQTKGASAVLYPHDVVGRLKAGDIERAIIAEGEFKALLLNQIINEKRIAAISGTAGAATFNAGWANLFRGVDVVLCFDDDDAGRDATVKVAALLDGIAASVLAVVWPSWPEADKKLKDITDFVNLGNSKDDVLRLIDGAVPVEIPVKEETEGQLDLSRALISIRDIRGMEISQNYICDKILPAQSITLLSGAGGVGKSTFALLLVEAIAQGNPFLGCSTILRPVIYVDFENSMPTINERAKRYELDSFHVWHTANEIQPPRIDAKEWELYKQLPQGAILIFDTLRACQNGDENSSQDMQKVMSRFKELRDMGFTIILLHHTAKGDSTRYKGSTAIQDLCDHSVVLQKLKRGTQDEIFDDDDTDVQYKLCTKDKTRYAPFSIFLEFELNRGFYPAEKDPRGDHLEGMAEVIKSLGDPPLQKDIVKKAKADLDIGKDTTLKVLDYGEAKFWKSEQSKKGQPKRYRLIID